MSNVIDFPDKEAIEQEACEWIIKFDGSEKPTQEEIAELKAWMASSPYHREALLRYANLWDEMDLLAELETTQASKASVLRRTGQYVVGALGWIGAPWRHKAASIAIVTSGLIVSAVALFSWNLNDPAGLSSDHYATAVGETTSAVLPDGSRLWLNTNTEVEVDYGESQRKLVLHRGEAHFEVESDSARPFEVYAGSRLIRAIGTAFSVFRDEEEVKVTVAEGKVDLAVIELPSSLRKLLSSGRQALLGKKEPDTGSEGQVIGSLEARQSTSFAAGEQSRGGQSVVRLEQEDLARHLAWREGRLVFDGEPLEEVVREVSRYTRTRIEIVDPDIQQMRVGGQFPIGEIEALFSVLEQGFGLEVTRKGDSLVQIHAARQK